nr:MetaGeneMark_Unknown Function [uncultured bacterium]ALS92445.1 MetaGeneMark_Unknown Function [uncultured bacterium]
MRLPGATGQLEGGEDKFRGWMTVEGDDI